MRGRQSSGVCAAASGSPFWHLGVCLARGVASLSHVPSQQKAGCLWVLHIPFLPHILLVGTRSRGYFWAHRMVGIEVLL